MLAYAFIAAALLGASQNNDIEWNGISHLERHDKRPLCPVDGESFDVRIQSYQNDLTGVTLWYDDGSGAVSVSASVVGTRGPYEIWSATVPATNATARVEYWFDLHDGSDVDHYTSVGVTDTMGDAGPAFVVNFADLSHAPVGPTVATTGAVFRVWAPDVDRAYVRGDFNNWGTTNPMTRIGDHWVAHVPNADAGDSFVQGDQYKYYFERDLTTDECILWQTGCTAEVFNAGTCGCTQEEIDTETCQSTATFDPQNCTLTVWKPDPRSRELVPMGSDFNSRLVNPDTMVWRSGEFTTNPWDEMIIYELHVQTFAGRNDFNGPASVPADYIDVNIRVPHFVELGVNTIEIMPVNEYPTDLSGGYNPVSLFAIESGPGTSLEFKKMLDNMYNRGLDVLMDVVWNHNSGSDNFMWNYTGGLDSNPWFGIPHQDTQWGPQLDLDNPEVRRYIIDSVIMWFEEYGVNGFRVDATDFINFETHGASGWLLMQEVNNLVNNRYVDKMLDAEQLPDDRYVTKPTQFGGAGFDSQWYDQFKWTVRGAIFDAAFGDPNMGAVAGVIDGDGLEMTGTQLTVYIEGHDEIWPSSGGQRMVKTIDNTFPHDDEYARGRHKLGHGVVLTAQGKPLFVQGTEWLEDEDFGAGLSNDPVEDRIDWQKKIDYADHFKYFQDMISIRKSNSALKASGGIDPYHVNEGGNVLIWERNANDGNLLVVIANFSNTDYTNYRLGFPVYGKWYQLINSEDPVYGGNGPTNVTEIETIGPPAWDGKAQSADINVPAHSIQIWRYNDPPDDFVECVADFGGDGTVAVGDILDFLSAWASGTDPRADINGDGVYAVGDILDYLSLWSSGCP